MRALNTTPTRPHRWSASSGSAGLQTDDHQQVVLQRGRGLNVVPTMPCPVATVPTVRSPTRSRRRRVGGEIGDREVAEEPRRAVAIDDDESIASGEAPAGAEDELAVPSIVRSAIAVMSTMSVPPSPKMSRTTSSTFSTGGVEEGPPRAMMPLPMLVIEKRSIWSVVANGITRSLSGKSAFAPASVFARLRGAAHATVAARRSA